MALKAAITRAALAVLVSGVVGQARADFVDWWLTPDQRGARLYAQGEYLLAARYFEDSYRKALAYYAAEEFASAAEFFAALDGAHARFYLGNATAQQGKLAEAAAAYRLALALRPGFEEAAFNLDWVSGLLELESQTYEDVGGTGGQLGADEVVFDDRADQAKTQVTSEQLRQEAGLTDAQLQEMWMRRVQTTPGDFLSLKFSYQLQADAL